jgi:heptose I phosphotransferase
MESKTTDQGRLTAAVEFLSLFQANGLDSFEKVMNYPGGELIRDFPGRRTVRLELPRPDGSPVAVYLKRYELAYLSACRRWLRWLGWPSAKDEAQREWEMIQRVRALGLRTATPVAVGQQKAGGMVTRSFLMTLAIAGAVEGPAFVRQLPVRERRRFLSGVAELARGVHEAGLVHKDFYLGHILVTLTASEPEMFLIDLQRVIEPCCLRTRWRVKDLGALAYSALKVPISRTDLMRCFKTYRNIITLDPNDRRLARQIMRRVAWLRTRRPKHDRTFEQLK